ncbi:toxin-antitoxin system HicB family antitoxin [Nostoc sp.]|uniref:toxin-antitoxin system HicB family antitoxin n=1 Tax=Nostoc sp. TaxID=1180 RepID=UPI002FF9063D
MSNLSVQLSDSLYKSLQELAKQDGISIDQFVATAVAEKIAALTTENLSRGVSKARQSRKIRRSFSKSTRY